jgi:dihydroorotase
LKILFHDFHVVDAFTDITGDVFVDGESIVDVIPESEPRRQFAADIVLEGGGRLVLTSGFVDMHAHFREPPPRQYGGHGPCEKETLEAASLAAARGGYTSVVCMANTNPPIDNAEAASAIKFMADALGIIKLYPAVSLSEKMNGKKLSPYLAEKKPVDKPADTSIYGHSYGHYSYSPYRPPLVSEDGKDIENDELFTAAIRAAAEHNAVVSCHCDLDGEDAAVERAVKLGGGAGGIHIAHISTKGAADIVRKHKKTQALTAEATPHHISLTKYDADNAGAGTFGKVAPPLRGETDRLAVIEALRDGAIDVIATDHAPHTLEDKQNGAPGFSGLETAFAVCNTVLVKENNFSMQKLFSLMSAAPARILGLNGCGSVTKGNHADIVILDTERENVINSSLFASRGKNTLFSGRKFLGVVMLTLCGGRITYQSSF